MKYRLIIANQTFEIGELLEGQPFRLFTYDHLGIRSEKDWVNLFTVHLYQDSISLKKRQTDFVQLPEEINLFSASDILTYSARGYQILKKEWGIVLFMPPTGKVMDDTEQEFNLSQILQIIHQEPRGFVLVSHA